VTEKGTYFIFTYLHSGKYSNNVIAEDPHGEEDDDDSVRDGKGGGKKADV
jgi:hypothetical protein